MVDKEKVIAALTKAMQGDLSVLTDKTVRSLNDAEAIDLKRLIEFFHHQVPFMNREMEKYDGLPPAEVEALPEWVKLGEEIDWFVANYGDLTTVDLELFLKHSD